MTRNCSTLAACALALSVAGCSAGAIQGARPDAGTAYDAARSKLDASLPRSDAGAADDSMDAAIADAGNPPSVDAAAAGRDAAPAAGKASMGGGAAAGSGGAGAGMAGTSSGSGAGTGGTPADCNGIFCEDFESGMLRTNVWTRRETSSGNSIQVQMARVAHGQYAAQFHAKGGTATSMMFLENVPGTLRKHYFGRLYYYATDFPFENGGHTAYITSSNGLSGFPYSDHHLEVASYNSSSKATWQMTYWTGDGPEYIGSGGHIPKGQWFCLEWEFNDAPDEIAVWVDGDGMTKGAAFRNINNHATGLLGMMTTLGVGFRTWHAMGAPDIDVYVDDIVLDDKRVGCL